MVLLCRFLKEESSNSEKFTYVPFGAGKLSTFSKNNTLRSKCHPRFVEFAFSVPQLSTVAIYCTINPCEFEV